MYIVMKQQDKQTNNIFCNSALYVSYLCINLECQVNVTMLYLWQTGWYFSSPCTVFKSVRSMLPCYTCGKLGGISAVHVAYSRVSGQCYHAIPGNNLYLSKIDIKKHSHFHLMVYSIQCMI